MANTILDKTCRALETLITAADRWHGLFPSIADRRDGALLQEIPPAIEGQREGDRSRHGSNLMHDQPALAALYGLADALGRAHYADAADRYLKRFAEHCTDTPSGLFPWGEHAYWHLPDDRLGNGMEDASANGYPAIHDHLRQAPPWLWAKLIAFRPDCARRFALGLDWHFRAGEPLEYSRHAAIEADGHRTFEHPAVDRSGRPCRGETGGSSCDFPRHCGFYLLDTALAWCSNPTDELHRLLHRFHDYWWQRRPPSGPLPGESRSVAGHLPAARAPKQALSLAVSVLDTADVVAARQTDLAAEMRRRARVYIDGVLEESDGDPRPIAGFAPAPHEVVAAPPESPPAWGSRYGRGTVGGGGPVCMAAFRHTGDERLLAAAVATADRLVAEPIPADGVVSALDAGMALETIADLFDQTGERRWLDEAVALADRALVLYFDDHPLPRGATGIDWYESQTGTPHLLHALARTALLADGSGPVPLGPNYTAR